MQTGWRKFLGWLTGIPALTALFLLLAAYVFLNGNWLRTRYPIQMDANGYYLYLPAALIYHDLGSLSFVHEFPEQFDRKYFLYRNIHGGYLNKYSPGAAILQLPFFAVAHGLAPLLGYQQTGYSPPYRLAVAFSSILYSFLAALLLRRLLNRYFPPMVVTSTILALFFGTNVLHYAVFQAGLVHNYLLFLFSLMLFLLDIWWRGRQWYLFALACASVGMMALIRPTEALAGFVPLGFLAEAWRQKGSSPKAAMHFTREVLAGIPAFLLCLLPLFAYWKYSTGNWIAYTYEQEGFYFDRPSQLWLGLFGFRKGWFVYTPMAALAFAGLIFFFKDERFQPFRKAMLLFLPLNLYLILSWYCWWYGGCFGQRAMIPSLALLAFPLAMMMERVFLKRPALLVVPFFFLMLNLFQSFQYQRQILHMDSMSWRAYAYIFGKWRLNESEKAHLKTLLDPADYSQRGKKLGEYFH